MVLNRSYKFEIIEIIVGVLLAALKLAELRPLCTDVLQCVFSLFEKMGQRANVSRRQGVNDLRERNIILAKDVEKISVHFVL